MRHAAIAILVLVGLGPFARAGDWHDLDGKPAPEVSADRWLNVSGEPPSLTSLEGRIWLLSFMAMH